MRRDSLQILQDFFDVDEDEALAILLLTQWVDQEIAIERHGYPKDNLIPAPMDERLAQRGYLERLVEAALDQDPDVAGVIQEKLS